MATTAIKSVRVARESTWGSLVDGVPDSSGLTFTAAVINDGSAVTQAGEPVMTDVSGRARSSLGGVPREPDTLKDATGDTIERRGGAFTLAMQANGIGDASTVATWAEMPWFSLLRTRLAESFFAAPATDAVVANNSVNYHDVTEPAAFLVGQIFKTIRDGRSDYAAVTDISGDVVTYSPALINEAQPADICYPMRQVGFGAQPATSAPTSSPDTISCAVELAGIGWKATAYAVTINSMGFTYTAATQRLDLTFECFAPFIAWSKSTYVPVAPLCPAGGVLHHLQTYLKISDTGGTGCAAVSAPANLAATAYCLGEMDITVTFTNRDLGCDSYVLAGREIDKIDVAGTLTLSTATDAFDSVIWDGETRSIMIGLSSGNPTDPGEGGAIYIPAASFTNDPAMYDSGADGYRTMLSFESTGWYGDDGSAYPANNQFSFAVGETY